jgi:hypothetical protein
LYTKPLTFGFFCDILDYVSKKTKTKMFDNRASEKRIGWKQSYGLLRKKAMEQELSLSGLVVSLSIAFFIVGISAGLLNIAYHSIESENEAVRRLEVERLLVHAAQAAELEIKAVPIIDTQYITLTQGQASTLTVKLKNTGQLVWKPAEVSLETGPFLKTISKVSTPAWLSLWKPVKLPKEIKPGQTLEVTFPIKAPLDIEGMIQENFQLVKNDFPVKGSLQRVFITINKPLATSAPAPVSPAPAPAPIAEPVKPQAPQSGVQTEIEPMMRIGLYAAAGPQRLTFNDYYDIYAGSEIIFSGVSPNIAASFSFNPASRRYAAVVLGIEKTAAAPLRFVPRTYNSVATLLDYKNAPNWNRNASDNRFRNIIEYRYTEPAQKTWLINELSIETYLKGLAETTNASTVEFQKVMATAARTYALYHYQRGITYGVVDGSTKHAANHFHIDSYYDQVYRGYNSEIRMPRLAAAIESTRGMVVTYLGRPVITPYFSNSDGRTRAWTEVWSGDSIPWLQSVPVPQDKGKNLYGHGVGMSARGALLMVNEGQAWDQVLKYFYTGIELAKAY